MAALIAQTKKVLAARFSTVQPLVDRKLDGLPTDSRIHEAFKIRCAETKLLELFAAGDLNGTVHTCVGQELFPIVLARYLRAGDYIVSNHRGHGHYLSVTGDFEGLIAEVMGRTSGASGGYGGRSFRCAVGHTRVGVNTIVFV
jgi:2-oxoisovalerate dehydrogenase E1 component